MKVNLHSDEALRAQDLALGELFTRFRERGPGTTCMIVDRDAICDCSVSPGLTHPIHTRVFVRLETGKLGVIRCTDLVERVDGVLTGRVV